MFFGQSRFRKTRRLTVHTETTTHVSRVVSVAWLADVYLAVLALKFQNSPEEDTAEAGEYTEQVGLDCDWGLNPFWAASRGEHRGAAWH